MIKQLFPTIDNKNVDGFMQFLSADCVFRFGNQPAVAGAQAIRNYVSGFFDSIAALSHQIVEDGRTGDSIHCHGQVCYTRKDNTELTVPFAVILKLRGELITEYLIFADTSELYK